MTESTQTISFIGISDVVPVFNGGGYIVTFKLDEARLFVTDSFDTAIDKLYMSADAHSALLQYIRMVKGRAEVKDGWYYSGQGVEIGGYLFHSPDFDLGFGEPAIHVVRLNKLINDLTKGTSPNDSIKWVPKREGGVDVMCTVSNDDKHQMLLNPDMGRVGYDIDQPDPKMDRLHISTDVEIIIMADRLSNDTVSGTHSGRDYKL